METGDKPTGIQDLLAQHGLPQQTMIISPILPEMCTRCPQYEPKSAIYLQLVMSPGEKGGVSAFTPILARDWFVCDAPIGARPPDCILSSTEEALLQRTCEACPAGCHSQS